MSLSFSVLLHNTLVPGLYGYTRRFAKRAVPPATLADKEEWSGMTDVVDGPKK